jgi:N-carbamoylputrescine amidase
VPGTEKKPMPKVKIAIAQIVCLDGDRKGNLARIGNAVVEAKAQDADIVCLPEMALLGWVYPDAHKRAHPIPGKSSRALSQLAREHQVHLCVGLAEKQGGCLYDTALLIDDKGEILLKHRKMNLLSELMTPPYTPGEEVSIAETRFGRIGVLICADTHDSGILAAMAELKPRLVLVPYGYAAQEDAWPGHGKALENVVAHTGKTTGAPVIGTNLIGEISHGPWRGMTYGGHSVAADGEGRILAIAKDLDRDVQLVTLSLDP